MTERIEDRLRAAAARTPDAVALVKGDEKVTFRELCTRMDAAARAVAAANTRGGPVAVHAVKTIDTLVCMMGCLVAGVPYVPVDASLPPARRAVVLDRAGSTLFLYDGNEVSTAPGVADHGARVMDIADLPAGEEVAGERSDVAYILFTSGSTGTPKGVVTTHANLLSALAWTEPFVGWGPEETLLCYAPLHFDMYPIDVYGAMGAGAKVVLAGDREVFFPQAIAELVRVHRVTQFMAVPSAWIGLLRQDPGDGPDPLESLRLVVYSGEEFPVNWLRKLRERLPNTRIVNVYGLVETNSVIGYELRPEHIAMFRVPLGYPLGPNRVYLLGDDGAPVTVPGVQGEIAVNGPSLSPRYLNDPVATGKTWSELTDADGVRRAVFRTGDYGEYGPDGIIHYRGRRDARVKTRGHRVELGDVESALAAHPAVLLAVAVARPHADVTTELVAYVETHDPSLDEAAMIAWARELLPAYMIPREIVVMSSVPRTATGKADRQTLLRQALS